jgi:branched-chain amino acid transport system substrate-binding protein
MKRSFLIPVGRVFIGLSLVLISLGLVPNLARGEDTVKIGQLDPFSGPAEYIGPWFRAAIKFAADEQNAKGGLLGKRIEIFSEDDEFKPDVTSRRAKELIMNRKVNFLGTGTCSGCAMAVSKVAASLKTIGINYGFSQPVPKEDFTRYYFRANLSPYNTASALAQYMATMPYRRYYLISQDYAYGHGSAKAFKEQLKIHLPDAKIVGEDFHPLGNKDFAPYITKIIGANADCVYSPNFGVDAINLVKQSRALGLKVPFPFATIAMIDPQVLNGLKEDAVGIHGAFCYSMRVNTPENQQMIAKYHEQYKKEKNYWLWWPAASMIFSWKMLFAAVEKAGSLDPEKIIDTFEGFRWKSPVGWYEMRKADHQVMLPMFGTTVQGGWNPYYNGSINPEVKFPWEGPKILTLPPMATAGPPFSY